MRRFALLLLLACLGCAREPKPSDDRETPLIAAPSRTQGFLSPHAGDIWPEGSVQIVRWSVPWRTRVHVEAAMGGKDKGHLALDLDAGVDSLVWQVPVGFVTGFGIERAENVRLRLENAEDSQLFVDSDTFTVVAAQP
jgi:hypothetical protein